MISHKHLREYIIKPVLKILNDPVHKYPQYVEELLIGTCAVETQGGMILKSSDNSRLSIFGVPRNDYDTIWQSNWNGPTDNDIHLLRKVMYVSDNPHRHCAERMIYNLNYACCMAIAVYNHNRRTQSFPHKLDDMGEFYCKYYNKNLTPEHFTSSYNFYISMTDEKYIPIVDSSKKFVMSEECYLHPGNNNQLTH